MRTGWKVSGAAHLALMLWAVLDGTLFRARPPAEMQVAEVSLISEAEYSALVSDTPEAVASIPESVLPEGAEEVAIAPAPETRPEPPAASPRPPERAPAREPAPDLSELREPPATEAEDRPPAPPTPPPPGESTAAPEPEAPPPPAERVAPRPTPAPPDDVARADEEREEIRPDPAAEAERPVEEQAAAAPDAAATEIVTEAERAPSESRRPRPRAERRPSPPAPASEPERPRTAAPASESQPAQPEPPAADPVAEAIAADLARPSSPGPAVPSGPPLTGGERDALRVAVQECWNVGALSSEALRTIVTINVAMNRDGTPRAETIRQVSASGGGEAAARQAFEAARRAIIRCGARGFPLPAEKYEQWRDIEITFNPENMRIR